MGKKKLNKKSPAKRQINNLFAYGIIGILVFIVYGQTIHYDFVIDDRIVISENKNVQKGIDAIPSIFGNTTFYGFVEGDADKTYRPIPLTSYALEIEIFGLNSHIHHFFNILVSAAGFVQVPFFTY